MDTEKAEKAFWDIIPTIEKEEKKSFMRITFQQNYGEYVAAPNSKSSHWNFWVDSFGTSVLMKIPSKRLMSKLKNLRPLKGKTIEVTYADFEVKEVKSNEPKRS